MNRPFFGLAAPLAALLATSASAQLAPYARGPIVSIRDLRGDYVAAGCALRGTGGSGTITIAGIPAGSTLKEALLYWTILDVAPSPRAAALTFDNARVAVALAGTPIGTSAAPCGSPAPLAFAFRADVTPWVSGNGTYSIANALDGGLQSAIPAAEGASLVVVYSNRSLPNRDIVLFEGATAANSPGAQAATTLSLFNATAPVTGASICFVVGGGQVGLTDAAVVNGFAFSRDPFDGGDPVAGIGFWDTDRFDVAAVVPAGATSIGSAVQAGTDCLLSVATALSITSPNPGVDVTCENLTPRASAGSPLRLRLTAANTTGAPIPVSATLAVYRASGGLVGTLVSGRTGTLPPGYFVQGGFVANLPNTVPPGLRRRPLYVVATVTDARDGSVLDDDHAVIYIE